MIPQGIEPPLSSPDDPAFAAEFDAFWKQVEPSVFRYVLPLLNGHHADAENATQEAARKLLRYWGGGFRPDAWRGWVLTIARNEAMNVHRHRGPGDGVGRGDEAEPEAVAAMGPVISAETVAAARAAFDQARASDGLTARDYTIAYLYLFHPTDGENLGLTAKDAMEEFNARHAGQLPPALTRSAEVPPICYRVMRALRAHLAGAVQDMSDASFKAFGLVFRDWMHSRYVHATGEGK